MNQFLRVLMILAVWQSFTLISYAGEQTTFFEELYDIPVMPGLVELPEGTTVFDKPGGRIVQTTAWGEDIQDNQVIAYYNEALPQLGWQKAGVNTYVRKEEKLKITFEKQGVNDLVLFVLEPR